MKKTKLLLSMSALSLLSLNAFAVTNNFDTSHAYIEAHTGYAILGTPRNNSDGNTTDAERGNAAYGINTGYNYAVLPTLAAGGELGYTYDGSTDVKFDVPSVGTSCAKISEQDVHLLLTGHYHASDSPVDFFAKAGAAYVMQKMSHGGQVTIGPKDEIKPLTAIGIGYTLSPNFNLHAQYSHIFGNNPSNLPIPGQAFTGVNSVDSFTLGTSLQIPGG